MGGEALSFIEFIYANAVRSSAENQSIAFSKSLHFLQDVFTSILLSGEGDVQTNFVPDEFLKIKVIILKVDFRRQDRVCHRHDCGGFAVGWLMIGVGDEVVTADKEKGWLNV